MSPGIIELLDCCSNLKCFFFSFSSVGPITTTIKRLSGSLRNHCPKLNSLILVTSSYGDVALASKLLRDGPVSGRVESFKISVILLDEGDDDDDSGDNGNIPNARKEMELMLRLLVECRHLRQFMLITR
ncbi:hypothetical protein BGZ96_001259, partial [Linnemannia gamsii]